MPFDVQERPRRVSVRRADLRVQCGQGDHFGPATQRRPDGGHAMSLCVFESNVVATVRVFLTTSLRAARSVYRFAGRRR
jgi:hypothetical protein